MCGEKNSELFTVRKYRFYNGFPGFFTIYLRKIRVNDRQNLIAANSRSSTLFYGDTNRLSLIWARSNIVLVCQKCSYRRISCTKLECPSKNFKIPILGELARGHINQCCVLVEIEADITFITILNGLFTFTKAH